VQREQYEVASSPFGRIAVSTAAIAQIVEYATAESYGVVALAGRGGWSRILPWGNKKGIEIERRDAGLVIELRVVVEHGLKLAEVGTAVRSRVVYELERMVGLRVAELQVHVEGVRGG
jgi:uncharacterized alkaline shock family protein YloU